MGRPRKYSLNENYFEKIDSDDKAYILGFIYADGSVYKNYLSIWLAIKDVEILDFIKEKLDYGGIIYNSYNKKKNKKYVGLTISSNKIVSDLNKFGIINNKTYQSKTLPIYNKKYEKAFLRGFFDGDGSIYSNNSRKYIEYTVNFSGNKSVLTQLKKILYKYSITSSKIRYRHNNEESCMLDIRGNKNIEKLIIYFIMMVHFL
jgi:intein/homing endonuclease